MQQSGLQTAPRPAYFPSAQITSPLQAQMTSQGIHLSGQPQYFQYCSQPQQIQISSQPITLQMSLPTQTYQANQAQALHIAMPRSPFMGQTQALPIGNIQQAFPVGGLQVSNYQVQSPTIQIGNPLQTIQVGSCQQQQPPSSKTPPLSNPQMPKSPSQSSYPIAPKINMNMPRMAVTSSPVQIVGNKVAIPRHGLAQCTTTQFPVFKQTNTSSPIQTIAFSQNSPLQYVGQIQQGLGSLQPNMASPRLTYSTFQMSSLQPQLPPGTYMPVNLGPGLTPVSPIANLSNPFGTTLTPVQVLGPPMVPRAMQHCQIQGNKITIANGM